MGIFKKTSAGGSSRKGYDLEQIKSNIPDNISSAIMMVDRDFMVTYANKPTLELLRTHADAFRKLFAAFDPEKIVGACIDVFHKNPAHQRKMLSDASRLPFKTEITVGDLKIALNVSASFDRKGNYVGNVLEWQDVTGARLNEGVMAAINRAQAVDRVLARRQDPARQRELPQDARLHARRNQGSASLDVRRSGLSGKRGISDVLGKARPRRVRRRAVQAHRQGRQGNLDPGELQPDPRQQRQAVQGGEVRHRHHRAEDAQRRFRRPARGHRQGAGRDRVHARRQDHRRQRQFPQDAGLYARAR